MSFASPGWLVLLFVPAALLMLRARRTPRLPFPAVDLAAQVQPSARRRLVVLLPGLEAAAAALLVVALAGPRAESGTTTVTPRGIDVQLVLDVSSSMNDPEPFGRPRLEEARSVIERFVRGRPEDRIGLLTFARFPRLACPATLDHEALLDVLSRVEPVADERADGTAIGVALASAVERLAASDARTRVVVLLTDGANNVDDVRPAEAAELARNFGIRVYAVAVGTRARAEELDEAARTTGGRGFRALDARMLEDVYETIDALEAHEFVEQRVIARAAVHPPLLAAALAVLLLRGALRAFWFRRGP
jgi:Ca-activated chloride channel family protein